MTSSINAPQPGRRRRCLQRIKSENSVVLSWMNEEPSYEEAVHEQPVSLQRKSSMRRGSIGSTSITSFNTGDGSLKSSHSTRSCLRSSNGSDHKSSLRRKNSVQFASADSVHEYAADSTSSGILVDEYGRRISSRRNRIPEIANIVVRKSVGSRVETMTSQNNQDDDNDEFFDAVETHAAENTARNQETITTATSREAAAAAIAEAMGEMNVGGGSIASEEEEATSVASSTASSRHSLERPQPRQQRRTSISSVSTLTSAASASITTLSTNESTELRSPSKTNHTMSNQQLKIQSLQARKMRRKQQQLF